MKRIGRLFTTLFGGFLALFTGAVGCGDDDAYLGYPPGVSGTVIDKDSGDPIAQLRVELLQNNTLLETLSTDEYGSFRFNVTYPGTKTNYTLQITDVDGAANGEYKGMTNTISVDYSFYTNIPMEKK